MVPELSGNETVSKKNTVLFIASFCFVLAVLSFFFWDIPVTRSCRELNPSVINAADIVTRLGVSTWYIVISAVLFLFFRFIYRNMLNAMRSLFVLLSVSLTGIFIDLLKWIGGRYRPVELFNHGHYGFGYFRTGYEFTSFPSGHAQTAFALATALTLLFPRWGIPLFLLAGAVAVSRIVLTAHYLSDVIAGAGIGILLTILIKYYFDRKRIKLDGCQLK
jgi:membrane-associated phospholipid phosphatase